MELEDIFSLMVGALIGFIGGTCLISNIAHSAITTKGYLLLKTEWQCTAAVAISPPKVLPIVEECTQYTKKAVADQP